MNRTEEDKLSMAVFTVRLGENDYTITPLKVNPQRRWRLKLGNELAPIVESFNQKVENKAMLNGLAGALIKFPEKLAEMVFDYAPNLEQEKILEEATEEQLAIAFSKIMSVAFPFLAQLGLVTTVVRASQ